MRKFAVIDVGSNSVRLMFVADGKVLYKALQTTRLGEGIADKPLLKPEAIERSAVAVCDFYNRAVNEGAEKVLCFATAAVRTAENRREFFVRGGISSVIYFPMGFPSCLLPCSLCTVMVVIFT